MSNNSTPQGSYGLDQQGRLIRLDPSSSRANVSRLSNFEETFRRLSSNFRQDDVVPDSALGKNGYGL